VVEVDRHGSMVWDGLWHSSLAEGNRHIGSANWLLGAAPVLVHAGRIEEALVIGLGTGITASTVAQLGSVRAVDVYELNEGLASLLRDYPDGRCGSPPIRRSVCCGRTADRPRLAEKRYDS
jgi:spermidine synthase